MERCLSRGEQKHVGPRFGGMRQPRQVPYLQRQTVAGRLTLVKSNDRRVQASRSPVLVTMRPLCSGNRTLGWPSRVSISATSPESNGDFGSSLPHCIPHAVYGTRIEVFVKDLLKVPEGVAEKLL